MSASRRVVIVPLALAALAAFLVWNGIFGLHVSRGEKQYLLEEARHAAGRRAAAPSVSVIMADTVRNGAAEATRWAGVVFVLSLAACATAARAGRRPLGR